MSLKRIIKAVTGADYSAAGRSSVPLTQDEKAGKRDEKAEGRLVLPRPLRFLTRYVTRIHDRTLRIPAGLGSAMAAGFLALSVGYGVYAGGHSDVVVSSAAYTAGLDVGAIKISGQVETTEADVLAALRLSSHSALLGFDVHQARERLIGLDWVEEVSIRKLFPGRLEISLVEKKPFALWQRDRHLSVIETSGEIITRLDDAGELSVFHAGLPQIVGEGAEKRAAKLFLMMSPYPSVYSRVASYVRVADRRWNILLRNNLIIQLPEIGAGSALAAVVKLDRQRQLLSREIDVVDMRLSDRMVLRVQPAAAAKRKAMIGLRSKRMRNAEKSKRI